MLSSRPFVRLSSSSLLLRSSTTVLPRFVAPLHTAATSVSRTTSFRPLQPFKFNQPTTRQNSTMSDHGNVIPINSDAEFQEKVINSKDPIVVDCFATWCGPCKAVAPKVAEFSTKYPSAKFYQIDVDKLSETAAELGIRAMPTFILFKDGQKLPNDVIGANVGALENAIKGIVA